MENQETDLKFKTNINCSGCVATVKPHLDKAEGIGHWHVNTADKDKTLTVHSDGITKDQVIETVRQAGFRIEYVNH